MEKVLIDLINKDFESLDQMVVTNLLLSVTLDHVMAESKYNLLNTRISILSIANGEVSQVENYVDCAKRDFRDVIMWAIEYRNKSDLT